MKPHKPSPQQKAPLRVCACCEWIYHGTEGCPRCNFASYGAHFVYGRNAYRFAQTQKPYFDRKMSQYAGQLQSKIDRFMAKETKPRNRFVGPTPPHP
jgi:hypothetical protein